ncbi:Vasopressin V1a receptor [Hypsibius exemplaris]|uniref:Vasopressin V1a receptor n=1 Tax=Hypsibius exemplaris TaxID=2072580 RepID=A0A1W0WK87_HYPEX|nr:Vasopressin V1a receptor [Hypsibius exemplaris]
MLEFNYTIAATYPLLLDFNASQYFNNTTSPQVDNQAWLTRDEDLAMLEVAMLGITFSIALFGNSAVLFVLLLRRQKITRMYFFILHLSLADLAVAFLNILPQLLWDITWRFQGNNFMCKSVKFLQVFSMYLSAWTLVMMAIDRFIAICRPLNAYGWRARRCSIMIGIAWLFSILCSLPQIFVFAQQEILPGVFDCWASFVVEWGSKAYVTWFALSIYIIPLSILMITYGQVTWTVWKVIRLKENGTLRIKPDGKTSIVDRSRAHSQNSQRSYSQRSQSITSRSRTTHSTYRRVYNRTKLLTVKLTAAVIFCYICCWTPFIFALLYTTFFPVTSTGEVSMSQSVFTILLLLANLNSCSNPWIYLFFSLGKYVQCEHGWKWKWTTGGHGPATPGISEQEDIEPHNQTNGGHSMQSHVSGSFKNFTNAKRNLNLHANGQSYIFGIPLVGQKARNSSTVAL